MRFPFHPSAPLILALCAMPLLAQDWDATKSAAGWARLDKDGSCVFFDRGSHKLYTWMKEAGIMGQLDLSPSGLDPEFWVLDASSNAWIVSGTTLQFVDKTGKPGNALKLPAEVADLAWDTRGFVLSYRTENLFLEKRDLSTGRVVWTYGNKPKKGEVTAQPLHRITIDEEANVLVASADDLTLTEVAGGKDVGQLVFDVNGNPPPQMLHSPRGRGAVAWWLGKSTVVGAVPASLVPDLKQKGLLLAKMAVSKSSMEFLATGLDEDCTFIGATEDEAVFMAPKGGLRFVPLK